jgi:hypothetical protein
MSEPEAPSKSNQQSFAEQADTQSPGIVSEFLEFLRVSRKWWLLPILIVLALVGVLVIASSSAIAPLIYPLF